MKRLDDGDIDERSKIMTDTTWMWTAKAAGAAAGSAISIAYVLPGDRREAAVRFAVGVASGLVFGGTAGLKIAVELGIEESLRPLETVLMGSAAASLCAWWALGVIVRALRGGRADKQLNERIEDEP